MASKSCLIAVSENPFTSSNIELPSAGMRLRTFSVRSARSRSNNPAKESPCGPLSPSILERRSKRCDALCTEATSTSGHESQEYGAEGCQGPAHSRRAILAAVGAVSVALAAERPAASAIVDEEATARVFESAVASVVSVVNRRRQGVVTLEDSVGSGFIWDERGYIVTNYHCVQPVLQDQTNKLYTVVVVGEAGKTGKEYGASIQSTDTSHDLAVLKIDAPPGALKPIKVGTSADLRVGQSAYSIGSPYGLSKTFTSGVVSGLNRGIPTPAGTMATGAIQTDAQINQGNSGGPLLDSGGRLIGVSTATFSSNKSMGRGSGVNFAVAVDTLMKVVPRLIVYGNASGRGV